MREEYSWIVDLLNLLDEMEAQFEEVKREKQRKEEQVKQWAASGCCPYCGKKHGFFSKKCKSCNRFACQYCRGPLVKILGGPEAVKCKLCYKKYDQKGLTNLGTYEEDLSVSNLY